MEGGYRVAAPYRYNGASNADLAEFNINYSEKKNDRNKLLEFVSSDEAQSKRVNVLYADGFDRQLHKTLCRLHDNLYARLIGPQFQRAGDLRQEGFRFFVDSDMPATNWVQLKALLDSGVTDVYTADDLAYDVYEVHGRCYEAGVSVRCVLNRIPLSVGTRGTSEKDPVFFPRDVDKLFGLCYDTFEFDCGSAQSYDWKLFSTLSRVWFSQKRWDGDMREINKDLKIPLFPSVLSPVFDTVKHSCRLKCASEADGCSTCEQLVKLGDRLKSKGIRFGEVADQKKKERL
jgi:hypothetical protein